MQYSAAKGEWWTVYPFKVRGQDGIICNQINDFFALNILTSSCISNLKIYTVWLSTSQVIFTQWNNFIEQKVYGQTLNPDHLARKTKTTFSHHYKGVKSTKCFISSTKWSRNTTLLQKEKRNVRDNEHIHCHSSTWGAFQVLHALEAQLRLYRACGGLDVMWGGIERFSLSFQCQTCHHPSLISLSLLRLVTRMSYGRCALMSHSSQSEWMLII